MFRVIRGLSVAILLACTMGCGSDSGSSATAQISIQSPSEDVEVRAGDVISYRLMLTNFVLAPPFSHRETQRNHPEDSAEEGAVHDVEAEATEDHHEQPVDEHGEEAAHPDDGHDHGGSESNPSAREGHYHIYVDDAAGTDPHLTRWATEDSFEVPELPSGTHSLRFELRDNNHVPIGTPGSEAVLFFRVLQ
jgi:hypothetical protein